MTQEIVLERPGLSVVIAVTDEGDVRLLHCSAVPFERSMIKEERASLFRLVEIQLAGEDKDSHHGLKYVGTLPGKRLRYVRLLNRETNNGRKWEIEQEDPVTGLRVISHMQFYTGLAVVRSWTEVVHGGSETVTLEYVSSFALTGVAKLGATAWDQKMRLSFPYSTCFGECQWREYALPEVGLSQVSLFSTRRFDCTSTGTWSSGQFMPEGYLTNRESGEGWFWQIEHNGSWNWEVSDHIDQLYLQLSGPTDQEHHWSQRLAPRERFVSVPVAMSVVQGTFDQAVGELTRYRRMIRRPNRDNQTLPVIFNNYMNCLFDDPTEAKLLPLIEAAAEAGCEYFCIDAGWFTDDYWWNDVGEWYPSRARFPRGIEAVLQRIRERTMIPGLWMELEVMGVNVPLAREWPDECFFMRHGKRVIDHGRYQLDFRHPLVIAHTNEAVDRLVQKYGIGYIKIDYNINSGVGTEVNADSSGAGLLAHNRAYLNWLDSVYARYPDLVIENCSSGGMRMDYALLSRHSIQSSSDQSNYRLYACIAAACPGSITPEQCAVWTYPLAADSRDGVIFNMINALLMRIHLSGELADLSAEHFALVREALQLYKKQIRADLPRSIPFWPSGLPTFQSSWVSLGLDCGENCYLAVWHRAGGEATCELPLPDFVQLSSQFQATCIYPAEHHEDWQWDAATRILRVTLPRPYSALLFRLERH